MPIAVTLSRSQWNGTQGLESVEAAPHGRPATWLGQPANTWQITNLIMSVITPRSP
jgi:hypothetical protein